MPERDGYNHGIPSWVDLGTTDVGAAKKFYGAPFGRSRGELRSVGHSVRRSGASAPPSLPSCLTQ